VRASPAVRPANWRAPARTGPAIPGTPQASTPVTGSARNTWSRPTIPNLPLKICPTAVHVSPELLWKIRTSQGGPPSGSCAPRPASITLLETGCSQGATSAALGDGNGLPSLISSTAAAPAAANSTIRMISTAIGSGDRERSRRRGRPELKAPDEGASAATVSPPAVAHVIDAERGE